MRRLLRPAVAFILLLAAATSAKAQTDIPQGRGLPVVVMVGVAVVELTMFDENAERFDATVDVRLRWHDPRLALSADEASAPPRIFRGDAAAAQLARIWTPGIHVLNQQAGDEESTAQGLRLFPDGEVELMLRLDSTFLTPVDITRFPFDRQSLEIALAPSEYTTQSVILQVDQPDLDFSEVASGAALDGWTLGSIRLTSEPLAGWYNGRHDRVVATLDMRRQPGLAVAAIFVPLLSSLLIPLLAIWLNRIEDGEFHVDTHEMVNFVVGGLFAVIALNFTVYSAYSALASDSNAVNSLFTLNYAALGVSLLVAIVFYRFRLVRRLLGPYVEAETFSVVSWAVPLIVLALAVGYVMAAVG